MYEGYSIIGEFCRPPLKRIRYKITFHSNILLAVSHQLKTLKQHNVNVPELRKLTAEFIRNHADDLTPFLTHSTTGDMLNSEQFEKYLSDLEATKVWGGQIELRALSQHFRCQIEVIQAEGPSVLTGEEFGSDKDKLILTYHRNMFGLGEHYNSTKPTK